MTRLFFNVFAGVVLLAAGCGRSTESGKPTPSPTAAPPAAVVAPSIAVPSGSPAVMATIPFQIPERLRRPLTREEIMKLPPETRDMILRAQGRPLPSPTKKKP